MDPLHFAREYTKNLSAVLGNIPAEGLASVIHLLEEVHAEQQQVFLAGNGGSAATATHFANDLMTGVAKGGGRGFRAYALSDNSSAVTAIANDQNYAEIFSEQLKVLARPQDVLIAISASGNSPNIVRAVEAARHLDLRTIGFLGMGGGRVARMVDIALIVPSNDYGPIESVHLVFEHLITDYLRRSLARNES